MFNQPFIRRTSSQKKFLSAFSRLGLAGLVGGLTILVDGCGSPSAANITLRKQNQQLQSRVDELTAQHKRDVDSLDACQRSHPSVPTLAPERLDQLFTTHGLEFNKLTGGENPDSTRAADTQLKVCVSPVDEQGTPIKSAGTFKVEMFDLGDTDQRLLGTWTFDLKQSRELFFSRFTLYQYALPCPWQKVPTHTDVTIRVTFDDLLTGRQFIAQTQAKVRPPAVTPTK